MNKNILCINDMAGYGKVALSAMISVLSRMGHHIYNLPTALVSNTLDYGKFDILETTEYMKNTIRVWDELGFTFDAVCTGFIVSNAQASLVSEYCGKMKEKNAIIFVDTIMGDDGKLYNGMGDETITFFRSLIKVADYIVPNFTEACFLTNTPYPEKGMNKKEIEELIEALKRQGATNIVITSCMVEDKAMTVVYEDATKNISYIPYEVIPVRFPGTGDIFSSVFVGNILKEKSIVESTKKAMDVVKTLIEMNQENEDKYKGIPVESCIGMLDE